MHFRNCAAPKAAVSASDGGMLAAQYESYEVVQSNLQEFIRTELETGIIYAYLALGTHREEKRQRTRQNARKAYDTAMRFWKQHAFRNVPAPKDLRTRRVTLRHLLLQLGETLET
jgi:hypothetical protein